MPLDVGEQERGRVFARLRLGARGCRLRCLGALFDHDGLRDAREHARRQGTAQARRISCGYGISSTRTPRTCFASTSASARGACLKATLCATSSFSSLRSNICASVARRTRLGRTT